MMRIDDARLSRRSMLSGLAGAALAPVAMPAVAASVAAPAAYEPGHRLVALVSRIVAHARPDHPDAKLFELARYERSAKGAATLVK